MRCDGQLPRRLSPSAIDRYRACPRQAWFHLVQRTERGLPDTPNLMLGNAVHAALEQFFGLPPDDREPTEATLHRCLRACWNRFRTDETFVTLEEERDWGERGLRMLSRFASTFDTSLTPVARERWGSVRLENGVEVFGKIDRIDGERGWGLTSPVGIVDYKTGRPWLESVDLPSDTAAQAYALAVEAELGRPADHVRLLYIEHGTEARWDIEPEDLVAARDDLTAVTSLMVADREFEARPGEACQRCPYQDVCPEAGRVELEEIVVPNDIRF